MKTYSDQNYTETDIAVMKHVMRAATETGMISTGALDAMVKTLTGECGDGCQVPRFLSVKDITSRLRVSKATVYRLIASGDLEKFEFFGTKITEESVLKFIALGKDQNKIV